MNWTNATSQERCWLGDTTVPLPDINTEDPTVVSAFQDWIQSLVREYSIDGIRLDGPFSRSSFSPQSLTPFSCQVSLLIYICNPPSWTIDTSTSTFGRVSALQLAYFASARFSVQISSTRFIITSIVSNLSQRCCCISRTQCSRFGPKLSHVCRPCQYIHYTWPAKYECLDRHDSSVAAEIQGGRDTPCPVLTCLPNKRCPGLWTTRKLH